MEVEWSRNQALGIPPFLSEQNSPGQGPQRCCTCLTHHWRKRGTWGGVKWQLTTFTAVRLEDPWG